MIYYLQKSIPVFLYNSHIMTLWGPPGTILMRHTRLLCTEWVPMLTLILSACRLWVGENICHLKTWQTYSDQTVSTYLSVRRTAPNNPLLSHFSLSLLQSPSQVQLIWYSDTTPFFSLAFSLTLILRLFGFDLQILVLTGTWEASVFENLGRMVIFSMSVLGDYFFFFSFIVFLEKFFNSELNNAY